MREAIPQLKTRIIRFVGGIIVAVVLISAWSIYIQYSNAISFAKRQAEDYVRALAEHSESAFGDADRIIRDSLYDLKREGGVGRLDGRSLFELLQRNAEGAPHVGSLFIADKNGIMLANSNTFPQPPISIADRDYFRHYLTMLGADLTMSNTIMGRLVARWRFNLLRPLIGVGNEFNGVIAVAFEADYFSKFMGPTSLGPRGRVLLIHNNGSPLVSEPYETNAYKADFSPTALIGSKLPASPSGTYQDTLGAGDGESRIISYQHLTNFPVVAVVALHKGDVLRSWAWKALLQSLMTIGLCAVIVVLTKFLLSHMDSLQSSRSVVSELEEELLHFHKVEALGQLAGGISHDFNELLTPILIYSEMVKRELPEDHPQLRRVDGIITAANKAKDLNQKLMSFGRKQTLHMEVLNLNEVINTFLDAMRSTIPENIAIDVKCAPGEILIRADRNQLEQVLLNLTLNAQDAIERDGIITVTSGHILLDAEYVRHHHGAEAGSYKFIEFKDSGRGMDEETLHHLYEPFFSTKSAGHGASYDTGLGLATVYGIIKQHGGYIETKSNTGEGTSIIIYLPVTADKLIKPAKSNAINIVAGTILLVEDNCMVREMAVDLLESEGFTVLSADSPLKALEIERSFNGSIDLLLTDVVMSEMNGVELYESLHVKRPTMPVLYISGYTSDAVTSKGTHDGEVNFMKKPFTAKPFIEKVKQVMSPK